MSQYNYCYIHTMLPRLKSIFTYPIKSCGSLLHVEVDLDAYGLAWDRHWMIADADGVFLTQREFPSLARIQPTFEDGCLRLTAPTMRPIGLPLEHEALPTRKVEVWGDLCEAWDEGDDAASWLSDYLHSQVRLVRLSNVHDRAVDTRYAHRPAQTTFTDGFPILIVSQASLDELNQRLIERGSDPVPITRFRPNLVVTDCDAFAEDTWHTVQIGNVTLDIVKPCARCVTTTVDQATGTVPDTAEPLATLNTFRKHGNKVMFAQNAIHHAPGTIAVGDAVVISEYKAEV